jgi:RNA polymerase sigma-70 factor (ECF subfamily)
MSGQKFGTSSNVDRKTTSTAPCTEESMAHELTRPRVRGAFKQALRGPLRVRTDTFERLFEEHAAHLYSFLAYRTGNRVLAEDLLSETFERMLRSRKRLDPRPDSERRWMYTIALNLLRDQARRNAHERLALRAVGMPSPLRATAASDPALAAVDQRDQLQRALSNLSDREREAIALRFGGDLKLRDVARVLGEGESAVEGRIYRALAKLRDQLR